MQIFMGVGYCMHGSQCIGCPYTFEVVSEKQLLDNLTMQ